MIMEDVAVVIILFNPSPENIENVFFYSQNGYKVYVIDNSSNDNNDYFKTNSNIRYKANNENYGIAKALNIAFNQAYLDGYKWVLTMDQDSTWKSPKDLLDYLKSCKLLENENSTCISFGPKIDLPIPKVIQIKEKIQKKISLEIENVDCVICSGNLVKTSIWKEVNGFTEKLFIDEVDFDFCFKIKEKNYKILKNNKYSIIHNLGDNQKETFFPQDFHNQIRFYYMLRNRLYMMKTHPFYTKKNQYKKYFLILIFQKLFFSKEKIILLKTIKKAIKDYKILYKEQA